MKQIFINEDNLLDEDIKGTVIRVKAMLVNSNNEVMLAHNNGTYQFPGGHIENDEWLDAGLIREIKEETGIDACLDAGPFMQIVTYDSNYFGTGEKICNKIYYYVINTDEKPNYNETNYDELERQSEFNLVYVSLSKLCDFLDSALSDGSIDSNIHREMKLAIEEYNRIYK